MQSFKETILLHLLLIISLFPTAQPSPTSYCGKIRNQMPFFLQNSNESSLLNRMLLCKSQKLYFRTSVGLFPVSSIDYRAKTLTISHPSCSSSFHFVSPSHLAAGFPPPPQPNSLLLFNCLNQKENMSPILRNCTRPYRCQNLGKAQKQELGISSCLLVDDSSKLDFDFDPKDLNCSHYTRVFRNSSPPDEGFELGTRVSFDIPDHLPDICKECHKPQGNCGDGLRCICHLKQCKDKVFSAGVSVHPFGNILLLSLSFMVIMVYPFMGY